MNTTLTNDQITAGAAVLCDHGQPIGRNAAIEVFDAMQGDAVELRIYRQALEIIGVRDCSEPHVVATEALVETGFWSTTPSPQIAEKVELPPLDEQRIIELWDSTESGGMMGRYVRFAHAIARDAIAASRRAAGGEVWTKDRITELSRSIAVAVAKNASTAPQLCFPDIYLGLTEALATPAPASAGQAGQVAMTEQQVADAIKEKQLVTDLGHRALINGDTINASLSLLTRLANSLRA